MGFLSHWSIAAAWIAGNRSQNLSIIKYREFHLVPLSHLKGPCPALQTHTHTQDYEITLNNVILPLLSITFLIDPNLCLFICYNLYVISLELKYSI